MTGKLEHIDLVGLTIVLLTKANNPSIVNPDFLRINKICPEELAVAEPAVTTPVFSQISYKGGITVKVDPNRVIFEQGDSILGLDEIIVPEMAGAYAKVIPHVTYTAVGINPVCVLKYGNGQGKISNLLANTSELLRSNNLTPSVQLKAIYESDKATISIDMAEGNVQVGEMQLAGFVFRGNIHRDLPQGAINDPNISLGEVIGGWRNDVQNFFDLICKIDNQENM